MIPFIPIPDFVDKYDKDVNVLVTADARGVHYEVSNYNMDGCPLRGWKWKEENVTGEGKQIHEAWTTFLANAEIKE